MIITINTEKKTINVPNSLRKQLESNNAISRSLNKKDVTIFDFIDCREYKLTSPIENKVKDTLNKKGIEDYMVSIKDTKSNVYNEYLELKVKLEEDKNGKLRPISFFTIKKWFYEQFPEQKPVDEKAKEKKEKEKK